MVVLGRVVPLVGCLASRLAGPAASLMIPLARRVPSLVVDLLSRLAGQHIACFVRWLALVLPAPLTCRRLGQARRWVGAGWLAVLPR